MPTAYTLEQQFSVLPMTVWPFVSDTDRVNRAVGVAEANGTYENGVLIGHAKQLGFSLEWVEHPFEFVAGRRLGVLREYRSGPLLWLRSTVELFATPDGGTKLVQTLEAEPRSVLYMPVIAAEVGVRTRRALERVYRDLSEWLAKPEADRPLADPLGPDLALSAAAERALTQGLAAAHARGIAPFPLAVLEATLRTGDPKQLGRLRPLELAARIGVDEDEMIDACLVCADVGLLQLRWELLCPHCRTSAQTLDRPEQLDASGRCEACAVALVVDPMSSLELVFRPVPAVREVEDAIYCLGSPVHSPHVVAQRELAPGAQVKLELALAPGAWLLTAGPGSAVELQVGAGPAEAAVTLAAPPRQVSLATGTQVLTLVNDTAATRRVKVEDPFDRLTVLTAARAAARALALKEATSSGSVRSAMPANPKGTDETGAPPRP